jgi:hypothetical protein
MTTKAVSDYAFMNPDMALTPEDIAQAAAVRNACAELPSGTARQFPPCEECAPYVLQCCRTNVLRGKSFARPACNQKLTDYGYPRRSAGNDQVLRTLRGAFPNGATTRELYTLLSLPHAYVSCALVRLSQAGEVTFDDTCKRRRWHAKPEVTQ